MNFEDNAEKLINLIKEISQFEEKEDYVLNIHEPFFQNTNAWSYLKECLDSGWVSSAGKYIDKFEEKISEFTNSKYSIAVTNGTVGLRLALSVIGVHYKDEVIIPPLSFIATANSISHLGAIPHFVDINPITLGMCPNKLIKRLKEIVIYIEGKPHNKISGNRIGAILPVHIFGNPAEVDKIKLIGEEFNIPIVEDAAEALGSFKKENNNYKHCGLFGEIGVISFNGNKIITTGGGGALITNNKKLADKAKFLSKTAKIDHPWEFSHTEVGWNDRMPNINAALGLSQIEDLRNRLKFKRDLYLLYKEKIKHLDFADVLENPPNCISNNWLINLIINKNSNLNYKEFRDYLLKKCHQKNIKLRPIWQLLNEQKMYKNMPSGEIKIAKDIASRIISLPSSPQLLMK